MRPVRRDRARVLAPVLLLALVLLLLSSVQTAPVSIPSSTPPPLPPPNLPPLPPPPCALDRVRYTIERYISMHNASMIAMEPDRVLVQRQFAVATYSCPEQMGNTMAQFLTTVAAAMVANRTLLFEKCAHDRRRCKYSSSVECDRFYTRSAWLPSIDDVLPRLQRVADNGQSWVANSGQSWVANNDTKRILPKS